MRHLIVVFIFFATLAEASEGLHVGPAPSNVIACWDSAVSMDLFGPNGSGVIVQKNDFDEKTYEIYVLTAYHVWKGWLNQLKGDEKSAVRGAAVDFEFRGSNNKGSFESDSIPLARGASGFATDEKSDLALLRFTLDKNNPEFSDRLQRLNNMKSPDFAECQKIQKSDQRFAIGFPKTLDLNRKQKRRFSLQEPGVIQKRWSEGVLTGNSAKATYLTPVYGVANPDVMPLAIVDVIKGNSGGPVCDQNGALVGVASGGTNEEAAMNKLFITKCEATRDFVKAFTSSKEMRSFERPTAQNSCRTNKKDAAVVIADRNLRKNPAGESLNISIYEGELVEILSTSGLWSQIRRADNQLGWIGTNSLESCSGFIAESVEQQPRAREIKQFATVITERMLRKEPGGESMGIDTRVGEQVEIISSSGPWSKVRLAEGSLGWIASHSIEYSPEPLVKSEIEMSQQSKRKSYGVVTGERALRKDPAGQPSGVLAQIGQRVEILSSSGPWSQVVLIDGSVGWISTAVIEFIQN